MPGRLRKFVIYRDDAGAWRWTLFAPDHQRLAESSGSFPGKETCIQHVRDVPVVAFGARIWNEDVQQWER